MKILGNGNFTVPTGFSKEEWVETSMWLFSPLIQFSYSGGSILARCEEASLEGVVALGKCEKPANQWWGWEEPLK